MNATRIFTISLLLCSSIFLLPGAGIAQSLSGKVTDEQAKPLPFATIKFGGTKSGIVTDLNGDFRIDNAAYPFIEVSYLGYLPVKITLPAASPVAISLQPQTGNLTEVVVKPPYDKIKRILNNAINNRDKHNPDKYDWYRCHVYYKMIADVLPPGPQTGLDTNQDVKEMKAMNERQHMLMSETYSIRTWKQPQKLQEDVVASKFSGFKKSFFTSLVTDILPFHAYNDYIKLNGRDYHNPVSRGFFQRFDFNLSDELMQGADTVWIISFKPRKDDGELKGSVYINSDGYAIAHLIANTIDTQLKRTTRIEQQYTKKQGKWFPEQLNYIINWEQKSDSIPFTIYMKGTSLIDSTEFTEDLKFHFDKNHTVRLQEHADELDNNAWQTIRPTALDSKEQRTYEFMDSSGQAINFDKYMDYAKKIVDGKFPVSVFDINLDRIYRFNKFEKTRWGLGVQTNEKLVKWLSVGGWAGYGVRDAKWKYGGLAEVYLDKYKEFRVKLAYDNDLRDPGRVTINKDLDKTYLRNYLLNRVDKLECYSASIKKRFGYLSAELTGRLEKFTPQYAYAFLYESNTYNEFVAKEAGINLRYAFAERTTPAFGKYYNTGTKYPILYARVNSGIIESGTWQANYTQAVAAVAWQKHLNRLGNERFLVMAGKSWSNKPLPLSKLFAGNGFLVDNLPVYAFGGLQTMYPYDYYTDQFVSFYFRHDFDFRLYRLAITKHALSSIPKPALAYNVLWGTLAHPEAQQLVAFSIPEKGYHEIGALLNSILRFNYANIYYITINGGYFYHLTETFDAEKNGKFVIGLGLEF